MRTALISVGGFALWGVCLGAAKIGANMSGASTMLATAVFVALWLAAAAFNMWMGIAKAGYSFREELPIFLIIFLLPTLAAVVVKWRFF